MEWWSDGKTPAEFDQYSITPSFQYSNYLSDALHFDLDDAPSFHIDDRQLVTIVFDPLAAARDALELGEHKARERMIVRRFFER